MSPAEERRRFRRVPLTVPVMLHAGGHKLYARTLDCSIAGAAVFLSSPLEVSPAPVRLVLELGGESLEARARVRHSSPRPPGFAVGFEFLGLGVADEQILSALIAGQDRRTSARFPVRVQVRYKGLDRQEVFHLSESTDISGGGVRFELRSEVGIGERVEVLLVFPRDRISRVGSVVRIDARDEASFAALCFDPVSRVRDEELSRAILGLVGN